MNESGMMHGRDWIGENIAGWFVSEKYDGCRAYWDGVQLWTRGGNAVIMPDWFARELPAGVAMDGELWAGYDTFTVAQAAVERGAFSRACRFMIHDMPDMAGDWAQRMAGAWRYASDTVVPAEVFPSRTRGQIKDAFCKVKRRGGEGLVARSPKSQVYLAGRSRDVLKIKEGWVF
jgi:DNA ligase-1